MRARQNREGIVLLVVLALLTLFAIVGISFVLYANAEANSSRYFRESESPPIADMDPELLLSYFLGQLVYDQDDTNGIYSALRGHSLARSMYGYNSGGTNNIAFNGTGRLRASTPFTGMVPPPPATQEQLSSVGDFYLINYQYFGDAVPAGSLDYHQIHDPERPGWRQRSSPTQNPFTGGFNAPYTYPDLNNMFLAAVKADGTILMPSFHRHWLFGDWTVGRETTTNPNWTNAYGKYMLLRPRPADNMVAGQSSFPYPEDKGGDVKNLINSPGSIGPDGQLYNNDSFWMDLGAPVMTAPDGTRFKPLFAPLIMDLDNRLNLNVHGNERQFSPRSANFNEHVSDSGWGPWEVNLSKVLNWKAAGDMVPHDWKNILQGQMAVNERGRLNPDGNPTTRFPPTNQVLPGDPPHFYGHVDYDGADENNNWNPSGQLLRYQSLNSGLVQLLPGDPTSWKFVSFPPRAAGYGDGSPTERSNHPSLYNFFDPQVNGARSDIAFPISNMEALLRYGETNSPGLTSSLYRLTASNFDPQAPGATALDAARRRGMITTHSFGVGRTAAAPWAWDPNGDVAHSLVMSPVVAPVGNTITYPIGQPIPFPPLASRNLPVHPGSDFQPTPATGISDWRSLSAALTKVDLNRKLAPYPTPPTRNGGAFDPVNNPRIPYPAAWMMPGGPAYQAQQDRQILAADIHRALVTATGAYNPFDSNLAMQPPSLEQAVAVRWLAQLAVNIVDFIDGDDIMTPFPWANGSFWNYIQAHFGSEFTTNYVFGTELPRLVINEVYAEFNRQNMDQTQSNNPPIYDVDFWVELYNPLFKAPNGAGRQGQFSAVGLLGDYDFNNPTNPQIDFNLGYAPLQMMGSTGSYPVYELMIAKRSTPTKVRESRNILGDPDLFDNPTEPNPDNYHGLKMTPNTPGPSVPCVVANWNGNPLHPAQNPASPSRVTVGPSGGDFEHPQLPTPKANPWNQGFYVVGPEKDFPTTVNLGPGDPPGNAPQGYRVASLRSDRMTYRQDNSVMGNTGLPSDANNLPTIFLRRLANPYVAFNAVTNPYVTVDYWEEGTAQIYGGTDRDSTPQHNIITRTQIPQRHSYGRQQPYWGGANPPMQRPMGTTQLPSQAQHTFFRQNSYAANAEEARTNGGSGVFLPFDWLVHLDRLLVSPMELLYVSAYTPHMLLQMFTTTAQGTYIQSGRQNHLAPWFDQRTRLYRAFEFLETHDRAAGVARGGRIPGLVNINTVWDKEILEALCDAQPSNGFFENNNLAPRDVDRMFSNMVQLRTPRYPSLTVDDRPFLGWAASFSAQGNDGLHNRRPSGINDTFLRSSDVNAEMDPSGAGDTNPTARNPRLFSIYGVNGSIHRDAIHPFADFELMSKLFNNVTTRSNVFAVWVTVGFFKVTQETDRSGNPLRPVKLGEEIGKAEGRNIRHRMFAIVDRSNLTTASVQSGQPGGPPILLSGEVIDVQNPEPNDFAVVSISGAQFTGGVLKGNYEGMPWTIQANTSRLSVYGYGGPDLAVLATQVLPPMANLPPRIVLSEKLSAGLRRNRGPLLIQVPFGPPGTPQSAYLGNPGPQTGFNARQYPWVVRYLSIIQ